MQNYSGPYFPAIQLRENTDRVTPNTDTFYAVNQLITDSEAYSEPCQTSKMDRFAKMVRSFYPLTIFVKRSILDF